MNRKGYTLVEMILVITLVGLLASVTALSFMPVLSSWSLGSARSEAVDSTGYALHRMMYEILQLKDAESVIAADANTFQFIDTDDNTIAFSLSGTNLMRNSDILARGVQSLAFQYWDINNASLAAPAVSPSSTDLWRLSIALTAKSGDQTVVFETGARPRNLARP